MHDDEPIDLPDPERGLRMIRWNARGFDELRRRELLSRECEFELVEGLILHREWGSRRHDRVRDEVARRLEAIGEYAVAIDQELRLDDLDSVLIPDISVLAAVGPPRLIVEISDTAPRLDALEKERLYARAGVEEYWHIELDWMVWRTHSRPHADGYGCCASGPSDRSTLTDLDGFDEISLDELLAAADVAA
jgi:hypothetical protein